VGGVQVCSLTMQVDVGTLTAKGTYAPAPSSV
jgi:hypothetical protein